MSNPAISPRLPSLDGWRALSILMVLGSHAGILASPGDRIGNQMIFDGDLGVRFFFVISGFLITWLLLQELSQSGKLHLRHFYIRRFLRILPVYFAFVLVLFGLQLFTQFRETAAGWVGTLTFTRNFVDGSSASGHFWSLAVEEQFYLLWPGLLGLLNKYSLRKKLMVMTAPIIVAPFFRMGTYVFHFNHEHLFHGGGGIHLKPAFLEILFVKYSFFCYFDALAYGCLCALLFAGAPELLTSVLTQKRRLVFLSAIFLVVVPHIVETLHLPMGIAVGIMVFGPTFQSLGFVLLLSQSLIEPDWYCYRPLNWRWMAWMGMLSYSLYVWQQIFCFRAWMGAEAAQNVPDPTWKYYCLALIFVVAILSYYGLERPLFRLRSFFRRA